MKTTNETQEGKVLAKLLAHEGQWLNGETELGRDSELRLTQYHRAIWNLENSPKWAEAMRGYIIRHSDFKDPHGFLSYKIVKCGVPVQASLPSLKPVEHLTDVLYAKIEDEITKGYYSYCRAAALVMPCANLIHEADNATKKQFMDHYSLDHCNTCLAKITFSGEQTLFPMEPAPRKTKWNH